MKNLKKLFCLVIAVCVIVCFAAPVVLAAGTGAETDPYVLEAGVSQQITIPAGGTAYVSVDATNSGIELTVNGNRIYYNFEVVAGWWPATPGPSGAAIVNLDAGQVYNVPINNLDAENEIVLDVVANVPAPGTEENPDTLVLGSNTAVVEAGTYGYNYNFIADVAGLLTITMASENWTYVVNNLTTYQYGDQHYSDDDPVVKSTTIAVNAGDMIRVVVNTYDPTNPWDAPAGEVAFSASFRVGHGTVEAPFEAHNINDVSTIEVAAGSLTYIAMNSQLNGMILNIAAQSGIAVMVNDVVVPAVDGLFSVELTGVPANKVVVANTTEADVELNASLEYPLGSEGNPIMIGNAADLSKIDVAAGSTTYLAINAMLNGNYLTIQGDSNTVVEVNGQAVTAVNGVFSVELSGAPMNRVVVTNNGTADASYAAGIGEPIPATGEATMIVPVILALVCVMGLAVVATKKVAA